MDNRQPRWLPFAVAMLISMASSTGLAQIDPAATDPGIVELRDIELYASDDAFQLNLIANSSEIEAESARLRVGLMFNEQRDNVISVGAAMNTRPGLVPGVTITIAARAYAALLAIENADVFALAPGLEVAYDYPLERFPLHLSGGVYYAPDVLSFGRADRTIDYFARAGLRITRSLTGFVGFRFLQFDTPPEDQELDDQVHVGVRWQSR